MSIPPTHSKHWWDCRPRAGPFAPPSLSCLSEAAPHSSAQTLLSLELWELMSPAAFAACLGFYRHAFSVYCDVSCTISLQALWAFQAWSSQRWMSLYQGLSALNSVGASCALGCLKISARFSKPLTKGSGPMKSGNGELITRSRESRQASGLFEGSFLPLVALRSGGRDVEMAWER